MAVRLLEMRRVMKDTASIYLHCDPTASHYLKLLMDAVFGANLYLNEMTWKRSSAHSDTRQGMRRACRIRDVVLVYSKTQEYAWNPQYMPYTEDYLQGEYRHVTPDGRRYKETDVTAAKPGGDTEYEWWVKRPLGNKVRMGTRPQGRALESSRWMGVPVSKSLPRPLLGILEIEPDCVL